MTTLIQTHPLYEREILHLDAGAPLCLRAERGSLWLTIDGEPDDIEIDAGQTYCFTPARPALVSPLGGPATVTVQREEPARWWQRWWPAARPTPAGMLI